MHVCCCRRRNGAEKGADGFVLQTCSDVSTGTAATDNSNWNVFDFCPFSSRHMTPTPQKCSKKKTCMQSNPCFNPGPPNAQSLSSSAISSPLLSSSSVC